MQGNSKYILSDRKVTTLLLMRSRGYKCEQFSLEQFQQLVAYCYQDLDETFDIPKSIEQLFTITDPKQCYSLAQELITDKHGLLLFRKLLCDTHPQVDFRSNDYRSKPTLQQPLIDYEPWYCFPSSWIEIAGFKFLSHENCLVMDNGLMVDESAARITIEKFINAGHHLSQLTFLSSTLKDGFTTLASAAEHECRPICLDFDYLTLLHIKNELPQFKRELKSLGYNDYYQLEPARFSTPTFRSAALRVQQFERIILSHIEAIISAATPQTEPKFFMSLGGVGSGKSKLEDFVKLQTNDNYVMFSVDNARTYSPIYQLLTASNNHDDDYIILKEFAYMLFEKLSETAKFRKINFFRDSSGIPYTGKNKRVLGEFKEAGFKTYCLVAASALYVAKDRPDLAGPVHERIVERFLKKGRAVPWPITLSKHISHPAAQCDAALDCNLDYLEIFDTMVPKGHTHTIAESHLIDEPSYLALKGSNDISKTLIELGYLPFASDSCGDFNYQHVSALFFNVECGYKRMIVVLDFQKYVDILQKSLFNENARGYNELIVNNMPWHIPTIDFPYDCGSDHNNYLLATARDVQN